MSKGNSKTTKINNLGSFVSTDSDYEEGRTDLTPEQELKISEIAKILTGYTHSFDTLHRTYAPGGIISIIEMQMRAKEVQNDIEEHERKDAITAINELKGLFGLN